MLILIFTHFLIASSLTWDPSPWDTSITGYKMYRGNAPRTYDTTFDVGLSNIYEITKIVPTVPYYWAVTAYNQDGIESDFSNEVIFAKEMPPLHISLKKPGLIQADVFAGGTFMIEASEDFKTWAPFREWAADSDYFEMTFPTQLHMNFFRVRFVSASPLKAKTVSVIKAQSLPLMPPMPPDPTKKLTPPKLSLKKKFLNLFKYHPGQHPNMKKGAEVMTGRKP